MAPGAGVSDESHMFAGLVRDGWHLHLLVPRTPDGIESRSGITVHTFPNVLAIPRRLPAPLQRLWLLPAFWLVAARAAVKLARQVEPALVLGFSHYGAWPAFRAGRAVRAPSVLKLFGVMHAGRLDWPRARYLYHALEGVLAFKVPLDHFLVLNDGTRGAAAAQRWGVPQERVTFLPNGVDKDWAHRDWQRDATRTAMSVKPGTVVFLSLSRLVDSKRVDRTVAAFAAAHAQLHVDTELWIVGDGPRRAALEAQCRATGVQARFLGTVQHDRVPSVMAAADVFVSTSELTNMAIPTCEAMLLGRPVIGLDVSGTAECVRDGETGLLAPEDDAPALAACIVRLANEGALRETLGAGARAFAARNFMDWDVRVAAELELFRRLAGAPGAGDPP